MRKGTGLPGPGISLERRIRREAELRARRAGVSVAAFSVAFGVYTSNPLLVSNVRLEGKCSFPPGTVQKHTDALLGQHWLLARTTPVQRRLQALPGVKRVTLVRWPLGEVTVRVEERKPYAVLDVPGGPLLIDGDGVVFKRPGAKTAQLPALAGSKFRRFKAGHEIPERDMRRFRDCLEGAKQTDLPAPRKLVVGRGETITLYTTGPLCIRLGRQDLQRKLVLAGCAVESLRAQGKKVRSLDIRSPAACTWSPHLS